jgi:drug/metabolite transporter (DMT)-like permease
MSCVPVGPTPQRYVKGVALCLVATVAWGGMFPVMTGVLAHVDPFTFTCARVALAGGAFVALLLALEGRAALRISRREAAGAWALGSAGFAGFGFLVFLGQQWAGPRGALMASIMMATQPMLGLLINWALRGTRPPLYAFAFIQLSFLGTAIVATNGDLASLLREPGNYAANGLILSGAASWVLYTVGASFFPQWTPLRYTAVTTTLGLTSVVAAAILLALAGMYQVPAPQAYLAVLPHLAYMALIAGVVGVLCWNMGNRIVTPLNGVLFMDVVPLTAFTVSALSGVVPTGTQLAGAGLSCAALVANNLWGRWRARCTACPAPARAVRDQEKLAGATAAAR